MEFLTSILRGLEQDGEHAKRILTAEEFFRVLVDVTSGTAGGFTVPSRVGPVVDALYPHSVALRAGATITKIETLTTIPRVTSKVSASWVSESECSTDSSDIAFSSLSLSPRAITATATISSQLLTAAPELAEPAVNRAVRAAIGYAFDLGVINGIGGAEPVGLLSNPNVPETVTFGGAPTLAKIADMEKAIGDAFAEDGGTAFITSTATRSKWRQTAKGASLTQPLWSDENEVISHPAFATPTISNSDNRVIYGAFNQLQLVFFGNVEVVRDPYALKKCAAVEYVFRLNCDAAPLVDNAFIRSTDSGAQ